MVIMKNTKYILSIAILGLAFVSCKPKFEASEKSAGSINPERFVAIGGGHLGGYMDDGISAESQLNSVANILAEQLKLVGGGTFFHPQIDAGSVGVSWDGNAPFKLGYRTDCKEETSLGPVRKANSGDVSLFDLNVYNANNKIGNYGIPRLRMSQLSDNGLSLVNPYFKRMASSASATVLQDLSATNATFFASFMGVEDVLHYARSGGKGVELPTSSEFETAYNSLLTQMIANGAKGVLATIPDPTLMPFFTTIPWNGLNLAAGDNNITLLNNFYGQLGYSFSAGENGFMAYDEASETIGIRQMLPSDRILLTIPLDSVKCYLLGTLLPFRDEHFLKDTEISYLRSQVQAYNNVIRSLATEYNLAVVETDIFFSNLSSGMLYNGVSLNAEFVSGGAYSLDGLHLNARGNALLANEFIKAINQKYNSKIPQVNAGNYNAILFP
jgi:hypothetical protein